jgi:hypothetical protein
LNNTEIPAKIRAFLFHANFRFKNGEIFFRVHQSLNSGRRIVRGSLSSVVPEVQRATMSSILHVFPAVDTVATMKSFSSLCCHNFILLINSVE